MLYCSFLNTSLSVMARTPSIVPQKFTDVSLVLQFVLTLLITRTADMMILGTCIKSNSTFYNVIWHRPASLQLYTVVEWYFEFLFSRPTFNKQHLNGSPITTRAQNWINCNYWHWNWVIAKKKLKLTLALWENGFPLSLMSTCCCSCNLTVGLRHTWEELTTEEDHKP